MTPVMEAVVISQIGGGASEPGLAQRTMMFGVFGGESWKGECLGLIRLFC